MGWTGVLSRPFTRQKQGTSRLGKVVELVLLFILAVQLARLIWALLAPVGPLGDWKPRTPSIPGPAARQALFASFDPFYPVGAAAGGVQQVTSLPLQLYGTRLNEGSGQGSAIIADDAGEQRSYAIGDEIAPGVTLKQVTFDHVVISRGGVEETLYINQSGPAVTPASGTADTAGVLPSGGSASQGPSEQRASGTPSSRDLSNDIGFQPRIQDGKVTGLVVEPQGDGSVFSRAGFHRGDIIVQVNGQSLDQGDIRSFQDRFEPGARLSLMVERGAATVPIAIVIPDKK